MNVDLKNRIKIELPGGLDNIGLKMSGGVDSSLLAYLLAELSLESDTPFKITPIVIVEQNSPFQKEFVDRIIDFIETKTGFRFSHVEWYFLSATENKIKKMREIESHLQTQGDLKLIVSGVTRQPEGHAFLDNDGPEEDRTGEQQLFWWDYIYTPFINFDKKVLADHYFQNNLMDWLFPLTRSCTSVTEDFSQHCGICWWCRERKWAFGIL